MGIQVWVRRPSVPEPREASDAKLSNGRTPQVNADPVSNSNASTEMDWKALRQAVTSCTLCELHKTRIQTVFGAGSPDADLLIIGEAPGADEDRQESRLWVGRVNCSRI